MKSALAKKKKKNGTDSINISCILVKVFKILFYTWQKIKIWYCMYMWQKREREYTNDKS